MNLFWLKVKAAVMAVLQAPLLYRPVLENGDSSPYFGQYEGQKYSSFDTSCCWDFSGSEVGETRIQLYINLKLVPKDHIEWLKANNYMDAEGNIYVSRRWIAILSGVRNQGNYQLNFWKLAAVAGLIPDSMLPYSPEEAAKWINQDQFNNEYFNVNLITPEMIAMGQEFLKRFSIQAEPLKGGYLKDISTQLQQYLKEGSIQIGIPVPQDGSWNRVNVDYPVGRTISDHAVELYKLNPSENYPFYIYDSYQPNLKQLSKNYYIPIITRVAIVPVGMPLIQFSEWMKFWFNVRAWMTGQPLPFPSVPVGKA